MNYTSFSHITRTKFPNKKVTYKQADSVASLK